MNSYDMPDSTRRIAIITHTLGGGVWSMTRFLVDALEQSGDYSVDIFLVATSSRDDLSVRILRPGTWLKGPRIEGGEEDGLFFNRVGAVLCELEFNRYRPRRSVMKI